ASVTYEFLMQRGAEIIIDHASYREVLPVDASLNPTSATFDKANPTDLTFDVTLNGNTLNNLRLGATQLINGSDYTFASNAVTLSSTFLNTLEVGDQLLTFDF